MLICQCRTHRRHGFNPFWEDPKSQGATGPECHLSNKRSHHKERSVHSNGKVAAACQN